MSTIPLPDKPAFSGLHSAGDKHFELSPQQSRFVSDCVAKKGVVYRIESSANFPCGHYILRSEDEDWFIKIKDCSPSHHVVSQAISIEAASYGAPVIASEIYNDPEGVLRIEVQPFVENRSPNCDQNDASLTGEALAQMHLALRNVHHKTIVQKNTRARHSYLAEIYRNIERNGVLPPPLEMSFQDMCVGRPFQFDLAPDAQIIHGDLNIGNILVDQGSETVCFIDCENMALSWLSPSVDIGMAIQRQILVADAPDSIKEASIFSLLSAYQKKSLGIITIDGEHLVNTIAWTCMRNICLLVALRHQGREPDQAEWLKFQSLLQLNQQWATRIVSAVHRIKNS
ncbi:phosphotransferase [uncultured Thalassospira sp.]|uniref:phosphotransferase n=1 Tax=uncultured Thalassospira sp. TaxID=404382 RepID=UPI00258BA191|nr:phosphotransferase [uncultured Thalassospira sp.]